MPRDLFSDLWALNLWAAEPERAMVLAPSLRSVLPPVEPLPLPPAHATPTSPREFLPETTYDTEDWYQSLFRSWEPKAPVIPPGLHVDFTMSVEVGQWVNRHVLEGSVKREKLQCFDFASFQLHRAGYATGGRPAADSRSWQVLVEYPERGRLVEEVQVPETLEAVHYVREALHGSDMPVLVGICLTGFPSRPNNLKSTPFVEPTNHFVVIVGMGRDERLGVYFSYYDYFYEPEGSDAEVTRLYLKPTLKLQALDGRVMLAEVRRSVRR